VSGQLFGFGFLPLKIQLKEKTKTMCCKWAGQKA